MNYFKLFKISSKKIVYFIDYFINKKKYKCRNRIENKIFIDINSNTLRKD